MTGEKDRSDLEPSLRVLDGERVVFASSSHWLHPLFELERHLEAGGLETGRLRIEDKIIGKAAAVLIVRLGFRRAYGARMSRLGERVFRAFGIEYGFGELVDRIDCATEALLEGVEEIDEAYAIVKARAAASAARSPHA